MPRNDGPHSSVLTPPRNTTAPDTRAADLAEVVPERSVLPTMSNQSAATIDLVFLYENKVRFCDNVSPGLRVGMLRDRVKEVLKIDVDAVNIRLYSLAGEYGTWSDEVEALRVQGRELRYAQRVSMQFMRPGDDGSVHFRVQVEGKDEPEEEAKAEEGGGSDGSESEAVGDNFSGGCVVRRTLGLKRTLTPKRMEFSKFTDTQTRRMFMGLKRIKYELPAATLPNDILQGIRDDYKRHLRTMGKPWDKNEATKRVFIQSVVERCVDAVNLRHLDAPNFGLELELNINSFDLFASGKADLLSPSKTA
jgi:hypothetical protein